MKMMSSPIGKRTINFDTVPTKGLLATIQSYNIHGNILKWLTSFLTQRRQRVLVNGKSSSCCDVLIGVPQGSVLGPILFIFFINDMHDMITSMIHLFADDTKISLRLTNQNQTNDFQNDIDRLDEWSDRWKLRFNGAKCKTMHIGYHNDKHIYQMGSGEPDGPQPQKKIWVLLSRTTSSIPNTWRTK